jgi:pimeloyl-ACP methyl ester carboxylesterase
MLSPATLNDDQAASLWLETFEVFARDEGASTGQYWVDDGSDRQDQLQNISVPCRVISFLDDLVTPAYLGAEVAAAIPDCDHVEIQDCGHYGYLERPDEVNTAMIDFLDKY